MFVKLILRESFNLLSTFDLLGNSGIVFGNVKVELKTIESNSFNPNFLSGFNPNKDGSSTPSDIA